MMGIRPGHHNLFETYAEVRMKEIKCAICNKPVDLVRRCHQIERDTLVFRVWCHGDEDTCELTHQVIEGCLGRIEPGYAFTTKRLDAPLMDNKEQLMMQAWLTSLRGKLEAGMVEEVKEELDIALGRIEEDRDGARNKGDSDGSNLICSDSQEEPEPKAIEDGRAAESSNGVSSADTGGQPTPTSQ